jgi:hypothetical protein
MRWLAFVMVFFIASLAHADDASDAVTAYDQMQASTGQAKEASQFKLATILYRMGLKQPAFGFFAEIAEHPNHSKWSETLTWLAKLGADMPEAADVAERVGKYDDAHIAALAGQRDLFAELSWLSGQYAYRNRNYDDAITRFSRVDQGSPLFGKAQMMIGLANVQARRSVGAVQAYQRVIAWLDDGSAPPDALRLRDLANLSMGRTYFSAAIRIDDNNGSTVDATKISAAAKYYRRVSPAGDFFLDAIFEDAWTRAWAGDNAHALGEARLASSKLAEAAVLEAMIQYGACRWDDAANLVAHVRATYEPRKRALQSELDALDKTAEDDQWKLAMRSPEATDRRMGSYVAYESFLADEKKRFDALPPAFRSSQLGNDVADALMLATAVARRNIAMLGHERIQRAKDELDATLKDAMKLSIDILAAQKNALENSITGTTPPPPPPPPPVRTRTITTSWPINGTHTPDPLYAATFTRACR